MFDRIRKWRWKRRQKAARARALELAVPLVAELEGFRANAYRCNAGYWTIGYGSRFWPPGNWRAPGGGEAPVRQGDHVTEEEARDMLEGKLRHCVNYAWVSVVQGLAIPDPGAMAGIASLIYNVGRDPVADSRFLENWRKGALKAAKFEFLDFNKATIDGEFRPVKGLTRRREREWKMMMEGK